MAQLARALSSDFDGAIRQRGEDYFHRGRVSVRSGSAWHVSASVRGTSRYKVELRRQGEMLSVSCTCPYFQIQPCKHLWAVVLAADEQRLLLGRGGGRNRPLFLVQDGIDDEQLDDAGDPYAEDWDELETEDGPDAVVNGHSESNQAQGHVHAAKQGVPAPRRNGSLNAPDWRQQLARLRPRAAEDPALIHRWPAGRELLYVVDADVSQSRHGLHVEVMFHDLKKDGTRGKPKSRYLPREWLRQLPDADDRRILALLAGAAPAYSQPGFTHTADDYYGSLPFRYRLLDSQPELIVPSLCRTGRCRLRLHPDDDHHEWLPLAWEEAAPWQFRLEINRSEKDGGYEVGGALRRGEERMELGAPLLMLSAGILFTRERAARFEHGGAFDWIALLREQNKLRIPAPQRDEFLAEFLSQPKLPAVDLPDELRYDEVRLPPRPRLSVKRQRDAYSNARLRAELSFDYGGSVVAAGQPVRGIVQSSERRVVLRDPDAELAAEARLQQLGWRQSASRYSLPDSEPGLELPVHLLPRAVHELLAAGWHVEAEGNAYRSADRIDVEVSSGIDWFELHGDVDFGGAVAHLPELLQALRRGEHMVRLDDGSFGLLPEEWLERYGRLADLGTAHKDHLRFTRSQVGLLDALLAAQPEARCDELFAEVREKLTNFAGIAAADPPPGFSGELRPYQKEGLGWLGFLRELGFGGCLADDMGLGKTVQVLALLEARRAQRAGTSLVVVPKSLIFNWQQEAARFAPELRVLDHTGPQRRKGHKHLKHYDLVLTTYGTLRNDAAELKNLHFDYVILDEAQAIKNQNSVSAKAARLLSADHRLALSGTPIENHLGELWSLFEFLNPGMLGTASVFKLTQGAGRSPDEETRKLLSYALRPFLLRRTKEQVIRDLPPKVEQTLHCEMGKKQRKLYDELRDHYRVGLLKRIERDGLKRSKIQILEALLRLRQAAIHPGLLDKRRSQESSAKLDMLLPQLLEALDEGHKTLVFSQFTAMLGILRERLDHLGIPYEYLDGKTRNRQERVERFQTDPDCRLFLISLKAGGLGLNLTAAEYVFLLDPWWNPAVEAQAIDRAHRIGQTNRVFAYRLIARDTIEEKVLELQNAKRDLADAIVGADNGLIRSLSKEDLELLLS